jgi:hypothetical protein
VSPDAALRTPHRFEHMRVNCLRLAAALVATSAVLTAQTPAVAEADRAQRFDRADQEAQSVAWVIECAQMSARARRQGAFGAVDSIGPYGLCVQIGQTRHGVFLDADSTLTTARNVRLVNFATMARSVAALDTAALLTELRAKRVAMRLGAPKFVAERRQFAPFSYRYEDGSVHVWLLPVSVFDGEALGGERWWTFAPDGATVRESQDAAAQWRAFTVPASRDVRITSSEADIPLLTELLLANLLARAGRVPTIVTGTYASTLAGNAWMQIRQGR